MTTASLADRLRAKVNPLDLYDTDWRVFVEDHKENIIANSTLHTVDIEDLVSYLYQPTEYLQDIVQVDIRLVGICRYINELVSDVAFDRTISQLYIPDFNYLRNLRSTYLANLAVQRKTSAAFAIVFPQ